MIWQPFAAWAFFGTVCLFSFDVSAFSSSNSPRMSHRMRRLDTTMKWAFARGAGSMRDMGGIGPQGEYYYIPSKKPLLRAPPEALGKEVRIPIYPRNQVLGSMGIENLGVYEMRYRQLTNDVESNGVFGHIYYSQEFSKLALVGTLTKVKKIERLEDGGIYAVLEGIGRFYLKDIMAEKPYLRARIQIFKDWCEDVALLETLEIKLMNEIRYSVKLMRLLYPLNNYTINDLVMRYRPALNADSRRTVVLPGTDSELSRRSKFSFAVMDMLKTDATTKLVFLQEPILEKRYAKMLSVLEESTLYLEGELRKRGIITEEGIRKLKTDALSDESDLELIPKKSWTPENYDSEDGDWKMQPILMD